MGETRRVIKFLHSVRPFGRETNEALKGKYLSPSECLSPRFAVRAEHVSDPADEEEENEAPFS